VIFVLYAIFMQRNQKHHVHTRFHFFVQKWLVEVEIDLQ